MDVLEEFRWQARTAYDWLESIVCDVTPEQALWRPPGRANPIANTYLHIVRNIDEDINHWLFRRPMLNQGPWLHKMGADAWTNDWDPSMRIDWHQLREYGRAMTAFAIETVDHMTEPDLHRDTDLSTADIPHWTGIDIIRLTVGHHVRLHGGEIACLKGLLGERGYVGGLDTLANL
jgi:hypothetical protein